MQWVFPFGDPRVKGCLPPYRGFSQAATSFFVMWCLGIHHVLLECYLDQNQWIGFDLFYPQESIFKVLSSVWKRYLSPVGTNIYPQPVVLKNKKPCPTAPLTLSAMKEYTVKNCLFFLLWWEKIACNGILPASFNLYKSLTCEKPVENSKNCLLLYGLITPCQALGFLIFIVKCRRWDSNPHPLRDMLLRHARIPIPPRLHNNLKSLSLNRDKFNLFF